MVATLTSTTYETVIGLEVHAQMLTRSKMFCRCAADYAQAEPNTRLCPVCAGLPGAMPTMNKRAIELVMLTGLALGCTIPRANKQDRKNYVYPDLPKGYQISQYDLPLCVSGQFTFESEGTERAVGITRVHIEEDTGRLLHVTGEDGNETTLVDLNRSGVPLMEIVGEPDLRSPEEARDFLIALRQVLRYIGASTGNMEEGAFRCDANISTRATDGSQVGSKVEIKNLNSFRAVERALRFEEQRQRAELAAGRRIPQETRGWSEAHSATLGQRTKEQAHDYRYFPEPDLPPLEIDEAFLAATEALLPELPLPRRKRFETVYAVGRQDAEILCTEREIADFFEEVVSGGSASDARQVANWVINDVLALQRERLLDSRELPVTAAQLRSLLGLVNEGLLTIGTAREVLKHLQPGDDPQAVAESANLLVLTDTSVVDQAVDAAIEANPHVVADYVGGKAAAIGRLIGEAMKRTGGRARPDEVRQAIQSRLDGK